MKTALKVYRYFNLISVDVACGAAVCAAFFADLTGIELRFEGIASLGITVWIVYSLDHLLDVRGLKVEASTERHLFHQQNFRVIGLLVLAASALDLCMVLFIRQQVFVWGVVLAMTVLIYLLIQRWIGPLKELIGALLYTGGVLLPALSLRSDSLSISMLMMIVIFFLTALINLVLFSWFDLESDQRDRHRSIVTWLGKSSAKKVLEGLFFVQGAILLMVLCQESERRGAFILLGMNLVLFLLFFFSRQFERDNYYRLIGDAVFLFPIPYLLWNG